MCVCVLSVREQYPKVIIVDDEMRNNYNELRLYGIMTRLEHILSYTLQLISAAR